MKRALGAVAAIAAAAAFTSPGIANAAGTSVTLSADGNGGLYGEIYTSSHCASIDRKVVLFEAVPGKDVKLSRNIAHHGGSPLEFYFAAPDSGDVYAKVKKADGCSAAKSPIVYL
jgi:hypothetical protein